MFKNLKKFIAVTFAALTLALGVGTIAPNSAEAAHWADTQMNWAMSNGYIKSDNRDSYYTRQEAWLAIARSHHHIVGGGNPASLQTYAHAQWYVQQEHISDGERPYDYVTRDEAAVMLVNTGPLRKLSYDEKRAFAKNVGTYDGTRGTSPATKAEVIAMMYKTRH